MGTEGTQKAIFGEYPQSPWSLLYIISVESLQRQLNDRLCCQSHCLLPEEAQSTSGEAIQAAAGTMALDVTDTVSRGSISNLSGSYRLSPFCRRNCFERVKALTQGHRTRIQLKPVFLTPARLGCLIPAPLCLAAQPNLVLVVDFVRHQPRCPWDGHTHSSGWHWP